MPVDTILPSQDSLNQGNDILAGDQQARSRRYILCYLLHIVLVLLHLVLLVISTFHPERRTIVPSANELLTTGLSGGLQAFYTLYTTLLVFVTQSLVLSTVFSGPTKLTQIHDMCGAWCGLGAALSTLWQQTKVTSSIFSIALVTVYFVCISVLHVTSSTIMEFQPFNATVTSAVLAVATWPDPDVDLSSLDWTSPTTFFPYTQTLYGNTTQGLANNTLYDIPVPVFVNATVNATTVNTQCGLLSNLSAAVQEITTDILNLNISVSMTSLDAFHILDDFVPLPNEIWYSFPDNHLQPFIMYLISTAVQTDDPVSETNHVYVNVTYSPVGGTPQNLTTKLYVVGCTLSTTVHTATLGTSGILIDSDEQPTATTFPMFSPGGDKNLTLGILSAMVSGLSGPQSPYCQPISSVPYAGGSASAFSASIRSALGMEMTLCSSESFEPYTGTPYMLTKDQVESATSQIAAELIWLAGRLGETGGGFDRETEEAQITQEVLQWRLNINTLPVISSLCASVVLCVLIVCMLWDRNNQKAVIPTPGVLEIMWFGSHSQELRNHLRDIRNPSVDILRAMSMFETSLWMRTACALVEKGSRALYTAVPLYDVANHAHSSRSLKPLTHEPVEDLHPNQPEPHHTGNTPRSHRWCYALHIVLVSVHIILLALLVYHPEHSVIIPLDSGAMTTSLSALLQAIYTLYSALLVFVLQQLALSKIVAHRRTLVSAHDVSGAWTGIGAAILILWQQRKVTSAPSEITAVVTYLASMLILHISSSSVIQWQAFNTSLPAGTLQSNLALPDSALNISQFDWSQIAPVALSIGKDPNLSMYGLSNNTLFDVPQVAANASVSEAIVNATTLDVQCGLVPDLTILSYSSYFDSYEIGFSLDGSRSGNFSENPVWKDVVYRAYAESQCAACPQSLFFVMTTNIDVDKSVQDPVALGLNWTYTPPGGSPQTSVTLTSIAGCSISAHTITTTLNLQTQQLVSTPDQNAIDTNTSWTAWSPATTTNIAVGLATALSDNTAPFVMFKQGTDGETWLTELDSYIASLLGLNLTVANETSVTQSSANPSVTLTPAQLENAIGQVAARYLWVAGQLGESGGGFDHTFGESPVIQDAVQWRLNVNTVPVVFASLASFTAFAVSIFILGSQRVQERPSLVSGTSVLEVLWLEANSEVLHSRIQAVEAPDTDKLRKAGMFHIRLGDVGHPCSASASAPEAASRGGSELGLPMDG